MRMVFASLSAAELALPSGLTWSAGFQPLQPAWIAAKCCNSGQLGLVIVHGRSDCLHLQAQQTRRLGIDHARFICFAKLR